MYDDTGIPPKGRCRTRIPGTTDEITPEWLTQALRSRGYLKDGRVNTVDWERIGVGLGFTTTIARGTVEYSGDPGDAPQTLVAKLPSGDEKTDALVRQLGAGDREVRFFNELAPDLGVAVPKAYYGNSDRETGEFVLLMEDMSDARLGDQLSTCPPEDAEAVIRNLARMHALWWDSDRLKALDWMPNQSNPARLATMAGSYRTSWAKVRDGIGQTFPGNTFGIAERFAIGMEKTLAPLGESPVTINHGDCRLGNLFFRETNYGTEVVRIDWQGAARTKGAADLAYFVAFTFSKDERKHDEKGYLGLYHRALVDYGVQDYPYDALVEDYRRGLFRLLFLTVIAVANVDLNVEGGVETANKLIGSLTILDDWDCGDLIPG